jgi:hypothetical protein
MAGENINTWKPVTVTLFSPEILDETEYGLSRSEGGV